MTTHSHAYIHGTSTASDSIEALTNGAYDLSILFSSWDTRCTAWKDAHSLFTDAAIYITWDIKDTRGLRDENEKIIQDIILPRSKDIHLITGFSADLDGIREKILKIIVDLVNKKRRPLSIIFDTSSCPRYYALAVLGAALKFKLAHKITFTYAEGKYEKSTTGEDYVFTGGLWRIIPVPPLDGVHDPGKNKHYLVSVGFEGIKTLRSVNQEDPDRVSILFPSPAVVPGYAETTRQNNQELIAKHIVPENQIVNAAAADAIEAWKKIIEHSDLLRSEENPHFLCCGTKPHSIAMGLAAICLKIPQVLYVLPDEHAAQKITPNGKYWSYVIEDTAMRGLF